MLSDSLIYSVQNHSYGFRFFIAGSEQLCMLRTLRFEIQKTHYQEGIKTELSLCLHSSYIFSAFLALANTTLTFILIMRSCLAHSADISDNQVNICLF